MKRLSIIPILAISAMSVYGQSTPQKEGLFRHLDVNITAGSTGVGFDLNTRMGNYLGVRAGGTFMPHFSYVTDFGIEVGEGNGSLPSIGNGGQVSQSDFDKLSGMLEEITGFKVDHTIDMRGTPTFNTFKLLVDVYPFKKKDFYFTAGIFTGGSRVAKAVNTTEDMPTLMAASIYNNMYGKIWQYMEGDGSYGTDSEGNVYNSLFMGIELSPSQYQTILDYGRMSMPLGKYREDQYDQDGVLVHAAGDTYRMLPDENSMVKVDVLVNKVRPYLGFGYRHGIEKTGKWLLGFDGGVMLWGGSPRVVTHDGTDLVHDVQGLSGKIGSYVDLFRAAKVFPVLNLNLSYRIF